MGALGTLKAVIALLAGIAIGAAGLSVYVGLVTVPAAREAGAQSERLVHEEQRRKAEAKANADREAAQIQIDQIERGYHERTAEQAAQLDILEASIVQETSRAQALPQAPPQAGGGTCPAAVPRSLRDALARVGTGQAGDAPAVAAPALR